MVAVIGGVLLPNLQLGVVVGNTTPPPEPAQTDLMLKCHSSRCKNSEHQVRLRVPVNVARAWCGACDCQITDITAPG